MNIVFHSSRAANSENMMPPFRRRSHRMKLYTYWRSQASFRVRIALHLKGLVAETASLDLLKGDQFDPTYRTHRRCLHADRGICAGAPAAAAGRANGGVRLSGRDGKTSSETAFDDGHLLIRGDRATQPAGTTNETMGRICWSGRHWNASTCPKRRD
jgi:hypothetical protein